ncbi:MAG: biotin/lipoyl-containing protein, partial [Pseudomonadota bacterium]|nr:biotin/lipoyl-containing protein [Pseudomonadota bacterium]
LIVYADTRAAAIDRLIGALAQLRVLGLPTNRAWLIECLADGVFREGRALISWLAADGGRLRESLLKKELIAHVHIAQAAVFAQKAQPLACPFGTPLRLRWRGETTAVTARALPAGGVALTDAEGARTDVLARRLPGGALQLTQDGVGHAVRAVPVPATGAAPRWHLQAGAVDWWVDDVSLMPPDDGGSAQAAAELRAPFNGRVIRVAAQPGQALAAGETALVVESMKLEHSLSPRADATVAEVCVAEGQQVAPGQLLLRFVVPEKGSA